MAGWTNSSAAASGTGGWRFTSHSTNAGGNSRWRERGRGRPPPQPHYRYRPVNSSPSSPPPPHHHSMDHQGQGQGQGASSTSARRPPPPDDKSPIPASSATMPPADVSMQPDDKASRNATNFECNVCFDLAADPVVTKCGHLFCWECLYQWLHVHSHHRECPVCKGQVTDDAIIPIYGRGGSAASVHTAPPRPTGARVESYRQQQPLEAVPPDDDDDEDPFDLQEFRVGFGVSSSLRDAMISSFMPSYEVDMEQHYDVHDYDDDFGDLLGFPVFASAGSGSGSSHGFVGDYLMESFFNSNISTRRHQPAVGANHQNHGRHGRRQRPRARAAPSADHSSADGGSGAFYHDTGAGPNVTAGGGSSRPSGGWTERRGRSNRHANSATGRGGMQQDSRRQRTNYN